MKKVDQLFLVSDTSAKAVNVTAAIAHVSLDNRAVDFIGIWGVPVECRGHFLACLGFRAWLV